MTHLDAQSFLAKSRPGGVASPHRMLLLMCIPGVSGNVANRLLEHFGKITEIQNALKDPKSFPRVRLDDKHLIGKARIESMRRCLG